MLVGGWVAMHSMRFGRHAYAVGGSRNAAFLAGVPVRKVKILAYTSLGLLAGLSALVLTSRSASYYPNASSGYLLNIYAAVFLGAAAARPTTFTLAGSALAVFWLVAPPVALTLVH